MPSPITSQATRNAGSECARARAKADREKARAYRQHRPTAAQRDGAADRWRDEASRQQAERQPADHPGQ